jgi:hypothetical protein
MMNWLAKVILDEEGKQNGSARGNSWKNTLTMVCREIKKQKIPEFRKLIEKISLHAATNGSILIEFAVCMPVLIILLYYVNDLTKIKRYYEQTEFVAQQMVNILQNISQNKEITEKKVSDAFFLAHLSMYPGKTMFYNGTGRRAHDLSFAPYLNIHYVKGLAGGKASYMWG